jgi:hypothetical protein
VYIVNKKSQPDNPTAMKRETSTMIDWKEYSTDFVREVEDFALDHQNCDGWADVVECWSALDIAGAIDNAPTAAEAIANVKWTAELVKVHADNARIS